MNKSRSSPRHRSGPPLKERALGRPQLPATVMATALQSPANTTEPSPRAPGASPSGPQRRPSSSCTTQVEPEQAPESQDRHPRRRGQSHCSEAGRSTTARRSRQGWAGTRTVLVTQVDKAEGRADGGTGTLHHSGRPSESSATRVPCGAAGRLARSTALMLHRRAATGRSARLCTSPARRKNGDAGSFVLAGVRD